jgi:hypothetical protein
MEAEPACFSILIYLLHDGQGPKEKTILCHTPSFKPNSVERNTVLHNIIDAGFNSPCYVFRNISITILNSEAQLFLFNGF